MAFPANPATGAVATEYGRTWVFDGTGWRQQAATLKVSAALEQRTVAQLVSPAADLNRQLRVTDAPGGEAVVYSDGSDYRRVSDQSPVV